MDKNTTRILRFRGKKCRSVGDRQKKTKTPNKNAVLTRSFKPTGLDRLQKYSKTPLENAYLELFFLKIKTLRRRVCYHSFTPVSYILSLYLHSGWVVGLRVAPRVSSEKTP